VPALSTRAQPAPHHTRTQPGQQPQGTRTELTGAPRTAGACCRQLHRNRRQQELPAATTCTTGQEGEGEAGERRHSPGDQGSPRQRTHQAAPRALALTPPVPTCSAATPPPSMRGCLRRATALEHAAHRARRRDHALPTSTPRWAAAHGARLPVQPRRPSRRLRSCTAAPHRSVGLRTNALTRVRPLRGCWLLCSAGGELLGGRGNLLLSTGSQGETLGIGY
jgi:hypothetical protein